MNKLAMKNCAAAVLAAAVLFVSGCGSQNDTASAQQSSATAESAVIITQTVSAEGTQSAESTDDSSREESILTPSPVPSGFVTPAVTGPAEEETTETPEDPEENTGTEKTPEGNHGDPDDPEENTGNTDGTGEDPEEGTAQEPAPQQGLTLIAAQDPYMYTYEDLTNDVQALGVLYQDYMTWDSIGKTPDGRELYHLVIGSPSAGKEIFINAGIHAREYINVQLVMKQTIGYLQHIAAGDSYGSVPYRTFWEQVKVHVVPSINPDGIAISQFGLAGIRTESVLQGVYAIAAMDGTELTEYYLNRWKANALGTDLNRNFAALWEQYQGVGHPSSDHYKGEYPGSAPEAAALINLTETCNFAKTISYHSQGNIIYWYFPGIEPVYNEALSWVTNISSLTGYGIVSDYTTVDPAGYSDWCIYAHSIPSLCIETASGECPYIADQFQTIWIQNLYVWEETLLSVL